MFQDPKKGTCDELTILENMALADNKHKAYGLSRGVNKRRTDYYRTLLETCGMGLEDRLNVKAGTLSGGQRQALALILANMTDIELFNPRRAHRRTRPEILRDRDAHYG